MKNVFSRCGAILAVTLLLASPVWAELPVDTKVQREVAYGSDPKQKIDVYIPSNAAKAPILVMVHGGGWRHGDKESAGVVTNKAAHWLGRGFIFISVNNRLLPEANPTQQAQDVANAVAFIQKNAAVWGGNSARVVLMGHSAGAHLVALLAADPTPVITAGGKRWLGTVPLDSAALDVAKIMSRRHNSMYDDAFGNQPTFWNEVSPIEHLTAQATPMLLVCSSQRRESCPVAHAFAAKATALGVKASVVEQNLTHMEINQQLGLPGAYTQAVDDFIDPLVGK